MSRILLWLVIYPSKGGFHNDDERFSKYLAIYQFEDMKLTTWPERDAESKMRVQYEAIKTLKM